MKLCPLLQVYFQIITDGTYGKVTSAKIQNQVAMLNKCYSGALGEFSLFKSMARRHMCFKS